MTLFEFQIFSTPCRVRISERRPIAARKNKSDVDRAKEEIPYRPRGKILKDWMSDGLFQ